MCRLDDGLDGARIVEGSDDVGAPRKVQWLSLIHISEPTRPRLISYAVFCLKKTKAEIGDTTGLQSVYENEAS